MTEVQFRAAVRDDCGHIASLFRIASEGVSDYVWSLMWDDYAGLSLLEIGERRYAREDTEFSYRNCIIAERRGAVVGMMYGYPMAVDPDADLDGIDPVLRPMAELEADGTFYIAALATYPECRGQGIGTRLIEVAHEEARRCGLEGLSLIVFEQNDGAVRLYRRHGFVETDRRAIVPHPMIDATGDVLLMEAPLG